MRPASTASPASSGVETSRIEAFSDGVFAIAITLLVLNLAIPTPGKHGQLAQRLGNEWPSYAAYVVSFLIIGIIWVNHHSVFRMIVRADRPLMFINLLLLLVVAVIPFPTALLAGYIRHGSADAHVAAAVYSVTMLAMSFCFAGLWLWVTRPGSGLLHERLDPVVARAALQRFGLGTVVYALAIVLSFLSAVLTLVFHFVIAIYYVFDQLPVGSEAGPPQSP
jgi:uncharacterized membrane protein